MNRNNNNNNNDEDKQVSLMAYNAIRAIAIEIRNNDDGSIDTQYQQSLYRFD